MKESSARIALAGFVYLDLHFPRPKVLPQDGQEVFAEAFELCMGGIYNTAVTLKGLGEPPLIYVPEGTGVSSEVIHAMLRRQGFEVHPFTSQVRDPAVSVVFDSPEDRSFLSFADFEAFSSSVSLEPLKKAQWCHIGGLREARALEDFTRKARATSNTKISVSASWAPEELDALRSAGKETHPWDLLVMNEAEATESFGSPADALQKLTAIFPEVIITLGKDGAMAKRGQEEARVSGIDETLPRTTGAGDAFCAGVLKAKLLNGSLEQELEAGVKAARDFLKGEFTKR